MTTSSVPETMAIQRELGPQSEGLSDGSWTPRGDAAMAGEARRGRYRKGETHWALLPSAFQTPASASHQLKQPERRRTREPGSHCSLGHSAEQGKNRDCRYTSPLCHQVPPQYLYGNMPHPYSHVVSVCLRHGNSHDQKNLSSWLTPPAFIPTGSTVGFTPRPYFARVALSQCLNTTEVLRLGHSWPM